MSVILIADDEDGVRRFLSNILSAAGHKVLGAVNGADAVALFHSNHPIDLVITDMRMPVMGGIEAVARIRETEPNVPVICITAYTDVPIPPNTQLLSKPLNSQELLTIIDRMLTRNPYRRTS